MTFRTQAITLLSNVFPVEQLEEFTDARLHELLSKEALMLEQTATTLKRRITTNLEEQYNALEELEHRTKYQLKANLNAQLHVLEQIEQATQWWLTQVQGQLSYAHSQVIKHTPKQAPTMQSTIIKTTAIYSARTVHAIKTCNYKLHALQSVLLFLNAVLWAIETGSKARQWYDYHLGDAVEIVIAVAYLHLSQFKADFQAVDKVVTNVARDLFVPKRTTTGTYKVNALDFIFCLG